MGGMTLIQEARTAGLSVEPIGTRLRIRGPARLEPLAHRLLAQKCTVLQELCSQCWAWLGSPSDLPPEWRVEWEERAAIREYDGGQVREHAEAEALREIVVRMWAAARGSALYRY